MQASAAITPLQAANVTALAATDRKSGLAIWAQLFAHIRNMVGECNSLARQPLWSISESQPDPATLTIRSTAQPERSLQLSVQRRCAEVQCVYGRGAGGASVELCTSGGVIYMSKQPVSVAQAAAVLLDLLVAGLK